MKDFISKKQDTEEALQNAKEVISTDPRLNAAFEEKERNRKERRQDRDKYQAIIAMLIFAAIVIIWYVTR